MEAQPPEGDAGRSTVEQVATQEQPRPLPMRTDAPLRVLVTGAEGFLGSHLLPRLVSRGHRIRATYYDPQGRGRRIAPGVDWHRVDLCRAADVTGLAEECDVVVHLAGLFAPTGLVSLARVHGTATRNVIDEARAREVCRIVYVSVLGARPGNADYFGTKFDAETAIVSAEIPSVILRPSVIYGPGDRFTSGIIRLLRRLPAFPLPGGGRWPLQPLAVEDMVDALCQCVERSDLEGREFEVAGPERLTLREVVSVVADVIGRRRPFVRLPGRLTLSAAGLARRAGATTPFSPEQLALMTSGGVLSGEANALLNVFMLKPLPFRDALSDYLESAE